jgi:hypothetical protein
LTVSAILIAALIVVFAYVFVRTRDARTHPAVPESPVLPVQASADPP